MAETQTSTPTRRERQRAATSQEIISTARRLLVTEGPEAVSLRAIARQMGMTAPGLYRYFDSREELIQNVCANIFTELGNDISRAIHEAAENAGAAADFRSKMTRMMVAGCREFRRWSLEHKEEFGLLFGVPLPGLDDERYDIASECALRFAGVFFGLFLELWDKARFAVASPEEIDPELRTQITRYQMSLGSDLPPGAIITFLRCWMTLYSAVAMEVFGHLSFALEDPAPMFEFVLADLARLVGLSYPPQG